MFCVFKCKPHRQQAIYVNLKPVLKEPVLLCQKCIVSQSYQAILLEDFLIQTQPMLAQYMTKDLVDICLNQFAFDQSLKKLKNQLYDLAKNKIKSYIQSLRNQFNLQKNRIKFIKNQIIHYQQATQQQAFIIDDQLEEQIRTFLLNQKLQNPKQGQINYLYKLLQRLTVSHPCIDIKQIAYQFQELLESFNVNLQKEIEQLDFPIQVFSEEEGQKIDPDDFKICKTLVVNDYYPSLDNLSNSIEKIHLQLEKPIDLMGFGKYSSLKELSITLKKSNMGLSRQFPLPNLKKLTINLKGNQLDRFEQLFLPETIIDFTLDVSQNKLDENSIYQIGQSIDNLKLERLNLNFNGYSLIKNRIWNNGLIQLCRILFPQQLKHLSLGLGRCCIDDVGLEYGIVKLLTKQRYLESLSLDLYSNYITDLGELARVNIKLKQIVQYIKNVKVNANQNPLKEITDLNPAIFKTLNCEHFIHIKLNEK